MLYYCHNCAGSYYSDDIVVGTEKHEADAGFTEYLLFCPVCGDEDCLEEADEVRAD
jgi:hypothetical protein